MTKSVYPTLEHTAKFYQIELQKIYDFLAPLSGIWSEEVLNRFPTTLDAYPEQWLSAMSKLNFKEFWQIEVGTIPKELDESGLNTLFNQLEELEEIPQWNFNEESRNDYPIWALNYVTQKKQHEIENFALFVKQSLSHPEAKLKMVDIGGGKGHLARILALYHGHGVTTIDTNNELQELGAERLEKYPHPENAGSLKFLNHTFGEQTDNQKLDDQLFKEAQVTLGLHTCGPLSLEHMKTYQDHQHLYNFGCCYQKLNSETQINLSKFSKERTPLTIGKHALSLATRGHTKINFKDYQLKKQVKYYRAALHLWMEENTQHNTFITVGSAKPKDYHGSFGLYAQKKLAQFNIHEEVETLNDYYEREDIQKKLDLIFYANLIRWRFGRIIEKFILINRALWQVEQGHHAQLYQIFDSQISPRNSVIFIPSRG